MLNLSQIQGDWTLFLDRDGVINQEKELDYIYRYNEFLFYVGTLEAMKIFADRFSVILIVTNQRGVGKGLMSEADLGAIHSSMKDAINQAGGRVDQIYFNTALHDSHPMRKPQTGMAIQAKMDFPQIDFSRSVMVGNNISDMLFGRNAGMHTVFLRTTRPLGPLPDPAIDLAFDSLIDFAKALQKS